MMNKWLEFGSAEIQESSEVKQSIEYIRASDEHISDIIDIFKGTYGREYPFPQFYDPVFLAGLINYENAYPIIFKENDTLLGFANFTWDPRTRIGKLGNLVTTEAGRGKGLATKATQYRIQKAKELGLFACVTECVFGAENDLDINPGKETETKMKKFQERLTDFDQNFSQNPKYSKVKSVFLEKIEDVFSEGFPTAVSYMKYPNLFKDTDFENEDKPDRETTVTLIYPIDEMAKLAKGKIYLPKELGESVVSFMKQYGIERENNSEVTERQKNYTMYQPTSYNTDWVTFNDEEKKSLSIDVPADVILSVEAIELLIKRPEEFLDEKDVVIEKVLPEYVEIHLNANHPINRGVIRDLYALGFSFGGLLPSLGMDQDGYRHDVIKLLYTQHTGRDFPSVGDSDKLLQELYRIVRNELTL